MVSESDRKELKRLYDRQYREKNRLKLREQKRLQMQAWRNRNREQTRFLSRKHYWKNPEKYRAYVKDWRRRNPDYSHVSHLRQHYGLTQAGYAELLARQNGVCAICKKPPKVRRLNVDHDHDDGHVRGLLCGSCNTFIGRFERADINGVTEYLQKTRLRSVG